jgi:hypothetical protein
MKRESRPALGGGTEPDLKHDRRIGAVGEAHLVTLLHLKDNW